ncbi:MAG TPA: universal stress protein [Gemmatimonadales bacterium]|nr:universal stress protein [Gemmatimonadales bacterium]
MTWQPIIAGVDGSPASLRAASFAWRLARAADAQCVLVHAVPDVWVPGSVAPLVNSPEIFGKIVSDMRRMLGKELGAEIPEAIRQGLVARAGRAGVVLAQVAREYDAGLIVVGGHHHGALARGFGGSTAHHLVRTAAVPVLVVEASARALERILVAVDFSAAASPTLSAAWRYTDLLNAQMGVVHVIEAGEASPLLPLTLDMDLLAKRSQEELERLVELEAPAVRTDDRFIRQGRADEEIAEQASAWRADLVVVGSHGKGWIDRLLIGSTAERLLNRLPTSLLVVPINKPAARPAVPEKRSVRPKVRRKGALIL